MMLKHYSLPLLLTALVACSDGNESFVSSEPSI